MTTKLRAQVKASFYYYFWGTATATVVATGAFVAIGFNRMAQSIEDLIEVANLSLEIDSVRLEMETFKLELDTKRRYVDPDFMRYQKFADSDDPIIVPAF